MMSEATRVPGEYGLATDDGAPVPIEVEQRVWYTSRKTGLRHVSSVTARLQSSPGWQVRLDREGGLERIVGDTDSGRLTHLTSRELSASATCVSPAVGNDVHIWIGTSGGKDLFTNAVVVRGSWKHERGTCMLILGAHYVSGNTIRVRVDGTDEFRTVGVWFDYPVRRVLTGHHPEGGSFPVMRIGDIMDALDSAGFCTKSPTASSESVIAVRRPLVIVEAPVLDQEEPPDEVEAVSAARAAAVERRRSKGGWRCVAQFAEDGSVPDQARGRFVWTPLSEAKKGVYDEAAILEDLVRCEFCKKQLRSRRGLSDHLWCLSGVKGHPEIPKKESQQSNAAASGQ